ncbi:hypothetical protein WPS_02350 [Vulcanimicrobium alpinum]|uniref:Uncharacterized protein n=1 Tax=Vulcanimicrobium alpinum TaxID=3016050 RepID=A0AAN1XTP2_UNVUL|nr:hypothetical protein [Vulcanimicrobium alpinum]BDE04959.1 hypothetical protein WPS_02350 [Vulcanimicrobium alpinum]
MTFDQWIDTVNAQVKGRLGAGVRTEELSWDSAMWVGGGGTVVAALAEDEATVAFSFDDGEKLQMAYNDAAPESVGATIAKRLTSAA